MALMRFLGMLFVFVCVLASCALAVGLLLLMLRFWPLLLIFLLALLILGSLPHKGE
jgi:hypothetical protein